MIPAGKVSEAWTSTRLTHHPILMTVDDPENISDVACCVASVRYMLSLAMQMAHLVIEGSKYAQVVIFPGLVSCT